MALPRHQTITIEEYLQFDQNSAEARYEYIDGYIRMLAGGTPDHAKISANFIVTLGGLLAENPCSIYTSDVRVRLSSARVVYPDVAVSCDRRDLEQNLMIEYPRLIVEVLLPSTEAHDRGQKFTYYQQCPTIQEYVLVGTQRQWVEVFRREKNNLWIYRAFGENDSVELTSLAVQFPIAKIYRNVTLLPYIPPSGSEDH